VPRRLLLSAAGIALTVALAGAGCADDVAPAATVGDAQVSEDDLMAEVDAWAASPTMLQQLQVAAAGSDERGYPMAFVDFVLTNRVAFELHNAEFEERGLELTDQDLDDVRSQLFADPTVTATVLDELGEEYADILVADVARQFKLQTELGDDYAAWANEAFTQTDISVSPRFGSWDVPSGAVIPPEGPTPAPTTSSPVAAS